MRQPVLTRWEYVGEVIEWVIERIDGIPKFAQSVVNANASISAKNVIASAMNSLSKEKIIWARLLFIQGYHRSFFLH